MAESLEGKTVLITGGTGSFGRAVLERVRRMKVGQIRIFSRDELKQELMRVELADPSIQFIIGDARSRDSVDAAMRGADYVFHAAALKQVPSCEFFPMQAVYTNIIGSHNVVESAIANGVKKVVCLSTDKAVYPINAMGMTKALMEKVAQAAAREILAGGGRGARNRCTVAAVRYGNVMYSRGSVIPLFMSQMRAGKPLTITEGAMTRFLLPLSGAIDLILFAFGNARPGDIFIKKSPACTVDVLAAALGELFGIEPDIRRIGIRHGEKLYETLASREELRRAQDMGDYWRVTMDGRSLDYTKYVTEGDVQKAALDDYTSHNTERLDVAQVKALLLTLPEVQAELAAGPVQAAARATTTAKAGTTTRTKPVAKTAARPGGGKPRRRPRKSPA
ncbi:MAG: polysaccharide biosynthesis protein [bacterium]